MRPLLSEDRIHPAVRSVIADNQPEVRDQMLDAIRTNDVVIFGMAINPAPRKARQMLDRAGIAYRYIGIGSYLSGWRKRNVWKMYTGWPTIPIIFVKGVFVGGASDLARLMKSGELQAMLAGSTAASAAATVSSSASV